MDCANSLLQLVNNLCGLASIPLGYACNLKDNVDSLRNANDNLKAKSGDVLARVAHAERGGGVQRTREVANWLDKVHDLVGGGDQVLQQAEDRDQIKCLNRCLPWNCWSSYKLGKSVNETLKKARDLLAKGEFVVLTTPLPPRRVLEMPMVEPVGLDISFSEVWKWLMDGTQVGMIGLYGLGGVGKTTLMRRIENEFLRANNGFDIVIWVGVSKQVNEDRIRDTIRKRLLIRNESWDQWSRDDRIYQLCNVLSQKKFVMLIDDVWGRLDLSNIGVPRPSLENGSKVVFTTRSTDVCCLMGANKTLAVQCLASEKAFELFEKNFGKSLVDCSQEILDIAKDIVNECKGLPLALTIVGQAMVGKDNHGEWRHALTTLRNNPHKLSGMANELYHVLEFSYHSLNDPTLQACFLYCCLFPEDYLISTNELIELWIGEGLLKDTNDVYHMRDEGECVLGHLKRACLLESGHRDYMECVKMHDVIRDMAIWIACDHGGRENELVLIEKEDDLSAKMISKWGEARKISLWGKWIQNIDQTPPRCPKLESLIVRETDVRFVPRGFFDSMAARLTVLDLSDNKNIELFPEEICNLISLQYLNLSGTCIHELPKEIKNLTHLRWLLLNNTTEHILIPTEAIASLPLNGFSQWKLLNFTVSVSPRTVCEVDHSPLGLVNEEEIIEELERMQHLTDLSINVSKSSSVLKIFQSPNLQKCIKRARIIDCQEDLTRIVISYSPPGNGVFSHLEELYIQNCRVFREMEITHGIGQAPNCSCFPNLVRVCIERCGLSDLSWLVHAPKLQHLIVVDCNSMEKIIGDGFAVEKLAASGLFSCLENLIIMNLASLTSIYDQILPFPQLNLLAIEGCPRLRKLPVNRLVGQVGMGRRCHPGQFHRPARER